MRRSNDGYAAALTAGSVVREEPAFPERAPELEVQARWFAGEFGNRWKTEDGNEAVVEDFGRWNREPGPDFVGVRARIGDSELRVGPVEIDRDARDWENHGHAANPAFRETLLHILLRRPDVRTFTRTCDHREVPQIVLPPTRPPRAARPIPAPLAADPEKARAILLAAARHRMDLKAASLERHAAVRDRNHALFSALAVALGYKHNRTPFLLLAQRAGVSEAGGPEGESLLFGLSGFLESPEPPAATPELRGYLRALWESWWRRRAGFERWILPETAWSLAGIRPANHPHRRVAALAGIARNWRRIQGAFDASRESFAAALAGISHPFWDHRFNLRAAELTRPHALIGAQRISDILINVWYPLAIRRDPRAWGKFLVERGPAPAARMRSTARRFFGTDADRLLRFAAIQQGLLQLDRDDTEAEDPESFHDALRRIEPPEPDSTNEDSCV